MKIVEPLHRLFIWGLEGSRKTSIALELYNRFFKPRGYELIALQAPSLRDFKHALLASRVFDKVFLLLDDLTYSYHHMSSDFRTLAQAITLIRHIVGLDKSVAVTVIAHYASSIPPVLRTAHTYVLTSLTTPQDVALASKYFKVRYLTLFRRLYLRYPNVIALVNWLGRHGLIKTQGIYHTVKYANTPRLLIEQHEDVELPLKAFLMGDNTSFPPQGLLRDRLKR